MQAVILAAGRGERMQSIAPSKPLLSVLGIPLLERSVRGALLCGATDITVVTGHCREAIQEWLTRYSAVPGAAQIRLVHNEAWADAENGASLLAAAPYIRGRFLLLMADHVYVPELLKSLSEATPPPGGAILATDGHIQRQDIDPHDVTYVQMDGNHIVRIDKALHPHDGFDTGAFLCSPDVLARLQAEYDAGRSRISDVMQALADDRLLLAHRVDGMYWQDVDTPDMHAAAEKGMLDWAAGKPADGMVARWMNRPLSKPLTQLFARTSITPNQISLVAFLTGLLAAVALSLPGYWGLAIGGILVQLASVVDGCDGELARLRLAPSEYGGWLDALLDRYADAAVLAGLTWHVMQAQQSPHWMWLGVLAISGSFVSSYSAHKADALLPRTAWRIGRDTRSLIIMIGALLSAPVLTLWIIAVSMNAVVLHRILALRQVVNRPSSAGMKKHEDTALF